MIKSSTAKGPCKYKGSDESANSPASAIFSSAQNAPEAQFSQPVWPESFSPDLALIDRLIDRNLCHEAVRIHLRPSLSSHLTLSARLTLSVHNQRRSRAPTAAANSARLVQASSRQMRFTAGFHLHRTPVCWVAVETEYPMYCRLCENLERVLAATEAEYLEASSLAYHQVSKKFAAYKNVEMERARAELQEHRMVCLAGMVAAPAIPAAVLRRPHQELLRTGRVMHAA
jgi:hypothetical protein